MICRCCDKIQCQTKEMICVTSLTSYIFFFLLVFQGFTDDQLMLVEQNSVMVEEREREIRQIVQSISDLNEIFRDLAGMVLEQVKIRFKKSTRAAFHRDSYSWKVILHLAIFCIILHNLYFCTTTFWCLSTSAVYLKYHTQYKQWKRQSW